MSAYTEWREDIGISVRMCSCGHSSSEHSMHLKTKQPCLVANGPDGTPCDCPSFLHVSTWHPQHRYRIVEHT